MIIHTGLVTPFVSFTKMEYKEMQTVGKRLAEIRKSNKIKQIELAEMLNVSQQVISNIERGVTTPDIEQLKKLLIFIIYHLINWWEENSLAMVRMV